MQLNPVMVSCGKDLDGLGYNTLLLVHFNHLTCLLPGLCVVILPCIIFDEVSSKACLFHKHDVDIGTEV
jgi:hypothetical protein